MKINAKCQMPKTKQISNSKQSPPPISSPLEGEGKGGGAVFLDCLGFRASVLGFGRINALLILLLTFFGTVNAGAGDAGAAFLKIPVDSRVVALGDASVAYVDNASALYYNPAGLARIPKADFTFMHNMWLLGMHHEYGAVGFRIKQVGSFGLSFNYWGSGTIPRITIRGDTIGEFSASDWTVNLGYGKDIGDFYIGTGFKYISEKNDSFGASCFGFDLGAMYNTPLKGLQMGFSLANLGTQLKVDSLAYSLPMLVRLGWRYSLPGPGLAITQDFIFSNADNLGVGVGAEYWIAKVLALRFGYRTGANYEGLSGLRAGLGILIKGFGIDYAYAPYGKLGMSNRFTVSFKIQ